ncbi:MAG: 30S ribosomal protein S3ae, partial [Thermoplasmata archaeon]
MAKRDRVAKRVKDRWKAKSWYTLHAPQMFNRAVLGETPAEEEEQ